MKKIVLLLIAVFLLPNIAMADRDGFLRGQQCIDGEVVVGFDDKGIIICKDILEVFPSYCGDGIVQGVEECDDGNNVNTDACLNNCTDATCGDGIVWTGVEECDDENLINGDGCSSSCQNETGPVCGNGIVDVGEECDDGNTNNNDACLNNCKVAQCGDGVVNVLVEQCDDANTINGDGCDSNCLIEAPTCVNPIIISVEPAEICSRITNSLTITGSNFDPSAQVFLIDPSGYRFSLSTIYLTSSTLEANVYSGNLLNGYYDVVVSNGAQCEAVLNDSLNITDSLFSPACVGISP